jgi:hypothetical protein
MFSQVGINTTGSSPDPNAMLDVSSSDKGFLPPRMTEVQRDAMGLSLTAGITIYNTDENCLNVFNGSSWESLCGGAAASDMDYTLELDKSVISVGLPDTSDTDPLTIHLHRISGTPSNVLLELSGVPAGVTYSLSPGGGLPDVSATLIFYTSNAASAGSYTIMVNATGGLSDQSESFTLEILGVKRVFLSDTFNQNSNLGGLAGADAICQGQANASSLGGTWVAWLSTSTVNAKDRITNAIYERLDGAVVAYNKADLIDGLLLIAPRLTASGEYTGAWARTGTDGNGMAVSGNTCNDWTSSAGLVVAGDPDSYSSSGQWTNRTTGNCSDTGYRLYCFEQ